ncbi:hypothetical protein ACFL4G_05190 [Thermodesulfobacteriota bacterium]
MKYKKCHGRPSAKPFGSTPEKVKAMAELHKAKEARRQSQQGQGRPIISLEHQGYRFTAVGNELHYGKNHKTFFDFLDSYIHAVLEPKWGNAEIAKPLEERHKILQWYDAICALQKANMKKPEGEIQDMPMNGLLAAYYGLAYNLYLLKHNAKLQEYLIRRLKQPEHFYAAYYETYVATWFILAGFELRLEDERDSSRTHPEFIATRDGQSYSVEAKTRHPGKKHFDVGNQLYAGLCIEAQHPRVIFIDMNVGTDVDFEAFANEALAAIRSREPKLTIQGVPAPPAYVYVTNQPYHLALNETRLPLACLPVGFKIPDFGYRVQFSSYTEAYKARMKYSALNDVQKAMADYSIPVTFDGEIPQFAFGEVERRFTIGERIKVADDVFMTLQGGTVVEQEKKACLLVTDDDGRCHTMSTVLSDNEIAVYKSHPETFFGRIVRIPKTIEDPMDLYAFFINSYKDTPRQKLLELIGVGPYIEEIKKLSDEELRYAYAEQLTRGLVRDKKKNRITTHPITEKL